MKEKKKLIITVTLIVCLFVILSVYEYTKSKAELKYNSTDIPYNNTLTKIRANNVKDALDEINAKVEGTSYTVENKTDFSNDTKDDDNSGTTNEEEKYEVKEVTGKDKEEITEKFSELDDVVVINIDVSDKDKGKEIEYKIDLPSGYSAKDEIEVYAYINGEKILIPHEIKDGKIVFKTNIEGKFIIGKKTTTTDERKYEVKEVTGKEKEEITEKFSELDDVVVMDIKINDEDKEKAIEYKIDLPSGYSEKDEIEVYAYINGEKILIPHEIKDGKIVFKTNIEGKFIIGKKASSTTTNNNTNNKINENIYNPKTGDIKVGKIITLLILSSIVVIMSLAILMQGGKQNEKSVK